MELFDHLTVYKQKTVHLCETELFEIELFLIFKVGTYTKLDCLK